MFTFRTRNGEIISDKDGYDFADKLRNYKDLLDGGEFIEWQHELPFIPVRNASLESFSNGLVEWRRLSKNVDDQILGVATCEKDETDLFTLKSGKVEELYLAKLVRNGADTGIILQISYVKYNGIENNTWIIRAIGRDIVFNKRGDVWTIYRLKVQPNYSLNFSELNLRNVNFNGFCFDYINFMNSDLGGSNFKGCRLRHANFNSAKLVNVNFEDADLTDSQLRNAILINVNTDGSKMSGVGLNRAYSASERPNKG